MNQLTISLEEAKQLIEFLTNGRQNGRNLGQEPSAIEQKLCRFVDQERLASVADILRETEDLLAESAALLEGYDG